MITLLARVVLLRLTSLVVWPLPLCEFEMRIIAEAAVFLRGGI
jgi:hypothetical protein